MTDPYKINSETCISFSGGRTSAYMLKRIIDANGVIPSNSVVCFANTGKEEEATLEFVRDCSQNWNVTIHWVEYITEAPGFRIVDFESASRNGEPFEALILKKKYLPNPVTRFCTIEMKIRTISKFCKSIGLKIGERDAWVGIRADEPRRLAKIGRDRCPLAVDGITAKHVGEFWKQNNFDLKLPNHGGKTMHGNCDLCFLKGGSQVVSLINEKPERAIWWARMETLVQSSGQVIGKGARFRKDRPSYDEMMKYTLDQASLFSDETIECFCGD